MNKTKYPNACNGTATPALANGIDEWGQMSQNVVIGNQVILRKKNRGLKERSPHSLEPSRARPLSAVSTSNVTTNKIKKEPQPSERSASLPQTPVASCDPVKRYSCPPMGISPSPSHSSPSTSSTTSSCSSPPPVKTSFIIGHDPLGWKLHPKSSSLNPRARANRLSLQIPLPTIPDVNPLKPEPLPKTKPALKPKPSRRRHSDSEAFLQSQRIQMPAVTLDELCAVHLRPLALSDESDDVFSEGNEKDPRATPRKIPPPVLEKTAMTKQIAQLIAYSRLGCKSDKDENIYTRIIKPKLKHSHQSVDHNRIHATKNGMQQLHISCDSERSTPRFPG
ncbi:uncharacterized protein LOC120736504 [Simochromis diagramma]|uniref:uncharacterized protein LOC120736504 n=1 Tax=Simochromis diagramma TaxID=43689 RepID=UPI001A7E724A|nr:uncharacterized protein LOC120736504 [Simochromis diagramma]XP_039892621.1 uncharacterized protein LOC120736504 [Simochromis diagramma]